MLITIDMAKNSQEVLIERPQGGHRRRLTLLATNANYDGLAEQLAAMDRPVVVSFEATGSYHCTLAYSAIVVIVEEIVPAG